MHEISICNALLDRIEAERGARKFSRVRRVRIEIGQFSCVEPDALRYAFELMTRGSLLEGATLELDRPPGRATCLACGAEVEVASRTDLCPACRTGALRVTGGDGMRFVEMEVS